MAKNTADNHRIAVKWVRDRAKKAYEKKANCCICDTTSDLELHHFSSITLLLNNWAHKKGYDISTDDGILAVRDEFIEEYRKEIYEDVVTLCNKHHVALHSVYGKAPPLQSAAKQANWIRIQRSKIENGEAETKTPHPSIAAFAEFY